MVGINPTVASKHHFHDQNSEIESKAFPLGLPSDHPDGGRELTKSRFHQRSKVPRMASQRSVVPKKGDKW